MEELVTALGPRQVFDLHQNNPLDVLLEHAHIPGLRLLVCGGDGTQGWILSTLDRVEGGRNIPLAIMPLGTGNDLSRSFGWGPGLQRAMRRPAWLQPLKSAPARKLDRWRLLIEPDGRDSEEDLAWLPALLAQRARGVAIDEAPREGHAAATAGAAAPDVAGADGADGQGGADEAAIEGAVAGMAESGAAVSPGAEAVHESTVAAGEDGAVERSGDVSARIAPAHSGAVEVAVGGEPGAPASGDARRAGAPETASGGAGEPAATEEVCVTDPEEAKAAAPALAPVRDERDRSQSFTESDALRQPEAPRPRTALTSVEGSDEGAGAGAVGGTEAKEEEATGSEADAQDAAGAEAKGDDAAPAVVYDGVFCNYFSIGVDSKIALAFHRHREARPDQFTSQFRNLTWYGYHGLRQGGALPCVSAAPPPVSSIADVFVRYAPGESEAWSRLALPDRMRGLVVVNLRSYSGGRDIWGPGSRRSADGRRCPEPSLSDGMVEVVGVDSVYHMTRLVACNCMSRGRQLAQASAVRIVLRERGFLQVDGEPWEQDPATITISLHGQSTVLERQA